jgi:hypothetical protein
MHLACKSFIEQLYRIAAVITLIIYCNNKSQYEKKKTTQARVLVFFFCDLE